MLLGRHRKRSDAMGEKEVMPWEEQLSALLIKLHNRNFHGRLELDIQDGQLLRVVVHESIKF